MFLPSNGIDASINAACATFFSNLLLLFCTSVLGGLNDTERKKVQKMKYHLAVRHLLDIISQIVWRFSDPVAISMIQLTLKRIQEWRQYRRSKIYSWKWLCIWRRKISFRFSKFKSWFYQIAYYNLY